MMESMKKLLSAKQWKWFSTDFYYSAQNSVILILPSYEGYVRIKYRKFYFDFN